MNSRNIEIRGETYQLKFGLKGLIELSKIPNLNVREHFDEIMHYGLIANHPSIIFFHFDDNERSYLLSGLLSIFSLEQVPSNQTIEEWYKKGIGEIGLSLSDFYCLTPYELDLAYEGYLRRMELQANLTQLSILRAHSSEIKPIKIIQERDYSLGSLEEREKTFKLLGIKEEN